MPNPSYTYSLTNGTTADASQVMQNFNDILNGATDGTKDLSISALTVAGTATLNGNVNLGNASGDDITVTGSLASTVPIKTDNSYDIGASSGPLRLRALYGYTLNLGTTSTTTGITLNNSVSSYSPTVLNHFEETTATATFTQSGGYSQAVTIRLKRIGTHVFLEIPGFAGTSTASASIVSGADIPARFRPALLQEFSARVVAVGAATAGELTISTGGVISLFASISGGSFLTANTSGLGTNSITYSYSAT